jgi:hypothetical protein
MRVGRGHKWNYDPGVWTEKKVTPDQKKVTPDQSEIHYAVTKRRVGKAPEDPASPWGRDITGTSWLIRTCIKLNANEYTTSMTGMKFKLAHRRAGAILSPTENVMSLSPWNLRLRRRRHAEWNPYQYAGAPFFSNPQSDGLFR